LIRFTKGFTLIELLVVVAIIGILAAIGVVSFGGFTAGAKASAVKANHASVVKFINTKIKECNIMGSGSGAQFYLKNSSGDLDMKVACSKNNVSSYDLAGYFVNHFNGTGISATRGTSNGTQVTINENGSVSLTIKTAYVDPNDASQRIFIENTILDER
jgi:type IV pilus assembly protein PilA